MSTTSLTSSLNQRQTRPDSPDSNRPGGESLTRSDTHRPGVAFLTKIESQDSNRPGAASLTVTKLDSQDRTGSGSNPPLDNAILV